MRLGSSFAIPSYLKTTAACLSLAAAAVLAALFGLLWLPPFAGNLVALLGAAFALSAGAVALGGLIVLIRAGRAARGRPDIFLELNRSRDPAAVIAGDVAHMGRLRRWLGRCLLGHDLLVGDEVEIKTWAEIRATLDAHGCMEQLPFMPEMLALCGQRAHVFRCMHRLFDHRKSRRMRHMDGAVLLVGAVCDGAHHGGCEAACHTIWKAAWLRRVVPGRSTPQQSAQPDAVGRMDGTEVLRFGTTGPRYTCQLTQLSAASRPLGRLTASHFLLPLVSGNVTLGAFAVGWLTHLFNEVQQKRHGVGFPAFEPAQDADRSGEPRLEAGAEVVVQSAGEIRATLNDQLMHRGLWLEPDMLKHCGQQHRIRAEVRVLIDIVSGEMITMKTPAYALAGVHFSGERQLFNAQYEPLFWRAVWLRSVKK